MNKVFVDTPFVVAPVNEKDQHHDRATELSETFDGRPLIITDAVCSKSVTPRRGISRSRRRR